MPGPYTCIYTHAFTCMYCSTRHMKTRNCYCHEPWTTCKAERNQRRRLVTYQSVRGGAKKRRIARRAAKNVDRGSYPCSKDVIDSSPNPHERGQTVIDSSPNPHTREVRLQEMSERQREKVATEWVDQHERLATVKKESQTMWLECMPQSTLATETEEPQEASLYATKIGGGEKWVRGQ